MTGTQEVDSDLVDLVERLFGDRSGHAVVDSAAGISLDTSLWSEVEDLGLSLVGIAESAGGSGGTLLDAVTINRVAAAHATPLPLAETFLAASILSDAGLAIPSGPLTYALSGSELVVTGDRAEGTLQFVPWARGAVGIAVICAETEKVSNDTVETHTVVFVPASSLTVGEGQDLAGQPCGPVTVSGPVTTVSVAEGFLASAAHRASLVRAAQIAGALETVSTLTRKYASVREQFGKPIGTFQAVQQHIVVLAQMAAMTDLSVAQATLSFGTSREDFEIPAAKLLANQNAATAARAAHAAHGAIGMTQEYRLQQLTRRLHTWRLIDGTSRGLAVELGRILAAAPSFHAEIAGVRKDQSA